MHADGTGIILSDQEELKARDSSVNVKLTDMQERVLLAVDLLAAEAAPSMADRTSQMADLELNSAPCERHLGRQIQERHNGRHHCHVFALKAPRRR